ncbi:MULTISPECIES: DUF1376 domain-containing protein [unclassified Acidovorax]|uniref:DUF1376 domain-containing protein n=1 Tax=unclassified Acidovorax TaxID=2684926 RepID=UPI001C44670E|nr:MULTISPECIES: DUF1376 domain-containing protein [unclassified Acidovorax]MBV7428067.1 DUF1376 domain-containing protein [Acidovorax sp. sif0732]MBV7449324.1 DUF1376 domain-containing protein [Acidovorax sp. sif0715]
MTPADCDLRDFAFMPLDINRLFGSRFHAVSSDAVWRAGLTLWARSFHQVPAASLPNDDVELCRLAELARDQKTWKKLKEGALYGWVLCSDGRYYHPIVAEKANEAWKRKLDQRNRSKAGNARRWGPKGDPGSEPPGQPAPVQTGQSTPPPIPQGVGKELPRTSSGESSKDSLKESHKDSLRDPKGQGQGQLIPSVPDGTGNAAAKPAADLTKQELWSAGKSLLSQAGMPEKQCGSFVGKLVKDYGNEIVLDTVRAAVVEQPADPAEWLKAACMRASGQRGQGYGGQRGPARQQLRHTDFDKVDYTAGLNEDGTLKA